MDKPGEMRQKMTAGMKREKESQSESTYEQEWLIKPERSILLTQWFRLSMVLAAQQSALFEVIDFRKAHKSKLSTGLFGSVVWVIASARHRKYLWKCKIKMCHKAMINLQRVFDIMSDSLLDFTPVSRTPGLITHSTHLYIKTLSGAQSKSDLANKYKTSV